MNFRLVPKSVTLNDLERRNGRYFALFQRIRVPSGRTADEFLFLPTCILASVVTRLEFHQYRRRQKTRVSVLPWDVTSLFA